MIGASALLLIGLVGPFEGEPDVAWQAATPPRPAPAATAQPAPLPKSERRVRAIQRRGKTNDITEMLRAMSLMQIGLAPTPERGTGPNQ